MKYFFITIAVLVVLFAAVWYLLLGQEPTGVAVAPTPAPATTTPVAPAPVTPPSGFYHDAALGYSITLPTPLASSTNSALYRMDTAYTYTAMGPGKEIAGVKFTIPSIMASGTNLSTDSYLSVEHLAPGVVCDAATFLGATRVKSVTVQDGIVQYSFASSTDAAAGNRYEEYVYALPGTSPCIAIRYFIHYAALENFSTGTVKAFDKGALMAAFDQIRGTFELTK